MWSHLKRGMATVAVGDKLATSVNCSKELLLIVMAAALWGHKWWSMAVQFVLDSEAVVVVLNSGYARDGVLMHLLWRLLFICSIIQLLVQCMPHPGQT